MKIAIDISQIVYQGTGVATYTEELVKNLLGLDCDNSYVLFGISLRKIDKLYDFYKQLKKNYANVEAKFFYFPLSAASYFWNTHHQFAVESLIGNVDIFHSSDWIQPRVNGKTVTTIHDLVVFRYPESSHPKIVDTHRKRLYWVKEDCDAVISDSHSTKDDIIKYLGIEQSKIHVVYPGIARNFTPQPQSEIDRVKKAYGLFDSYILTVGTLEPRKNIKSAIAAFERYIKHPLVTAKKQPTELVIVGNKGWGDRPTSKAHIQFLGYVAQNDLPALYSGASFFLYPSLYEGFGFPILEAMACGCPVIASSRGSIGEIAATAAIFVDPENIEDIAVKMTKLLVDSKIRQEIIEKGKERAEHFQWQRTAKNILTVYQKVVS